MPADLRRKAGSASGKPEEVTIRQLDLGNEATGSSAGNNLARTLRYYLLNRVFSSAKDRRNIDFQSVCSAELHSVVPSMDGQPVRWPQQATGLCSGNLASPR
jgi:hypothetical protein